MQFRRIQMSSIVILVLCIVSVGFIVFKNDMDAKKVESSRSTVIDGYINAKDVANKCIGLFQLDEIGRYKEVKSNLIGYLSDDLALQYFPSDTLKGIKEPSKLTIQKSVCEKLDNGDYVVKVDFDKEADFTVKSKRIIVTIKKGRVYSIETIK